MPWRAPTNGYSKFTCAPKTLDYGADMSRYAIDAPTLLHIVAANITPSQKHQLVAPILIRSHALTLLLTAVRRGDMDEEVAQHHQERITELKMRLLGDRVSRRTAWKIAREQGWDTTYDAEYIAVAKLQADALVTVDPKMAALAQGIVRVAPLQALVVDDE
jgi:predicted nucleic acid-binding protein